MTRRTRILIIAAALLMPSLAMGAWYGITRFSDHIDRTDGLGKILHGYGYLELTPPSRLFGPGTIATVETLSDGSLSLHLACKLSDQALSAMWQKSTTLDRSMVTNIQHTLNADADALGVATAHAAGKRIKDVNVSLRNMSIVTMPYESLIEIRDRYVTGNCEQAVAWNLRAGARVCQTEEVLQADVVYSFGFDDGLGATEKLALAEQFAASIGIEGHVTNTNEVRGDDLYLGVKVRLTNCFKLADSGRRVVLAIV